MIYTCVVFIHKKSSLCQRILERDKLLNKKSPSTGCVEGL